MCQMPFVLLVQPARPTNNTLISTTATFFPYGIGRGAEIIYNAGGMVFCTMGSERTVRGDKTPVAKKPTRHIRHGEMKIISRGMRFSFLLFFFHFAYRVISK